MPGLVRLEPGTHGRRQAARRKAWMAGSSPDLYSQVCIRQSAGPPMTADHTESGEKALPCFETRSPSAPQHEVCS
jgi:hypothetical protein